jgi:drug/metabolite transporter (DMT)-like permease
MFYQLLSRIAFGIAPLGFAYAALVGPGPAGFSHIAAVLFLMFIILFRKELKDFKQALKSKQLMLVGFLFIVLNIFGGSAMVLVPLPTFSALIQLSPLIGLLLAPLFNEKTNRYDWLALPFGIVGAFLVIQGGVEPISLLGWLFLAVEIILVVFSVNLFARSKKTENFKAAPATAAMMIWGCPVIFLQPATFGLSAEALLALAFAGVMFAVGNSFIYKTFDEVPAHRTLLLKPLSALTTTVLAVSLLGQALTIGIVIGGIIIMLSGLFVEKAQKQDSKKLISDVNPKLTKIS